MGGFNFSAAPSAAPATTIFLGGGPVSERLTMLVPSHIDLSNGFVNDRVISGLMMNTWTSWDRSFYSGTAGASTVLGSFTAAPDGTNTAQHVAATTFNDVHFMSAGQGFPTGGVGGPPAGGLLLRMVFTAKAAELTRCMMIVDDMQGLSLGNQQGNADGFKCVFDLAGGQIGVANTAIGPNNSVAGPAQIVPIGNGFYQCSMEGQINFGQGTTGTNGIRVSIYLDNGSGTGAQSTTFTGDGTSGIYLWKCTCLPPVAFSLTGVTFFDDFTDPAMGTIDRNNTKAPGFKWYVGNSWTGHNFNGLAATPSGMFSQSGSILTIANNGFIPPFHDSDLAMETAVQLTPSTNFVGQYFAPPALFECRCAYDVSVSGGDYSEGMCTFWTNAFEALLQPDPPANSVPYFEYDFFECAAAGTHTLPHSSAHISDKSGGNDIGANEQNAATGTVVKWYSLFQYGTNQHVWDPGDGNIYSTATFPNTSTAPHLNLAQWTLVGPLPVNGVVIDMAAQNLFSTLWCPWNTPTGPLPLAMSGMTLEFFNNICVSFGSQRFGPNVTNSQSTGPYFQLGDKYHYALYLGCNGNANIYVDYVKVTQ